MESTYVSTMQSLITALYNGQGLGAIADCGAVLLRNPVTIVDSSFKGLAVSTGFETEDERLRENLRVKYMDSDSIRLFLSSEHIRNINRSNVPVITGKESDRAHGFESRYGWLDSAIKINGIVVGYFSVAYLFSSPQEGDEGIADQLVKLAAMELQKDDSFIHSHGIMYESLLSDLLSGKLTQERVARYRMNSLGGSFGEELFLMAVGRPAAAGSAVMPSSGQETLRRLVGNCFSVHYDDCIVLLMNRNKETGAAISDEKGLEYFLHQNELLAGISNGFSAPTEISTHYSQCRASIELGSLLSDKSILMYGEFVPEHIFRLLSAEYDLSSFCDARLGQLVDVDRDYRIELLETFYTYIVNLKDASMTAKQLNIHKNTLFHRVNTVIEEFKLSPGEGEQVFDLLFGYRLLRYMRDFRPEKKSP